MRDGFLPELPNILTLSDQEMALLKKYAEKWAVQAFFNNNPEFFFIQKNLKILFLIMIT